VNAITLLVGRDALPTMASGLMGEELGNVSTACTEDQDAGALI